MSTHFEARYTVHPDRPGGFLPDTFAPLLHSRITMPGLDPGWTHQLVGVTVDPGGDSAELLVHSEPGPAPVVHGLQVVDLTPPAHVRLLDADGNLLAEAQHPVPLLAGQEIQLGGEHWMVSQVEWPHRDPNTRMCTGGKDWQHVVVNPAPRPVVAPQAVTA